jgi:predicted AAA+ superfamily ATPase
MILFIDEVQRIENPGLLLKSIIDLKLPIKHIATGSSQLEIKSRVKEFLTGRQLSSLILPFSLAEIPMEKYLDEILLFGSYPQVIKSSKKEIQLKELYQNYRQKDIIEILKIGKSDIFQNLLTKERRYESPRIYSCG